MSEAVELGYKYPMHYHPYLISVLNMGSVSKEVDDLILRTMPFKVQKTNVALETPETPRAKPMKTPVPKIELQSTDEVPHPLPEDDNFSLPPSMPPSRAGSIIGSRAPSIGLLPETSSSETPVSIENSDLLALLHGDNLLSRAASLSLAPSRAHSRSYSRVESKSASRAESPQPKTTTAGAITADVLAAALKRLKRTHSGGLVEDSNRDPKKFHSDHPLESKED